MVPVLSFPFSLSPPGVDRPVHWVQHVLSVCDFLKDIFLGIVNPQMASPSWIGFSCGVAKSKIGSRHDAFSLVKTVQFREKIGLS